MCIYIYAYIYIYIERERSERKHTSVASTALRRVLVSQMFDIECPVALLVYQRSLPKQRPGKATTW